MIPATEPLHLTRLRVVPSWLDYNGHMTESRYLHACSETTDALLARIGADRAYVATGRSYYTVETHLMHLRECRTGDLIEGSVQVLHADEKRMHVFVRLARDDAVAATLEQMLLHVDMGQGRAVPASGDVLARLMDIARAHLGLPWPTAAGRCVGQKRRPAS
jgi:carnitine 3-dehydrogenase